MSQSPPLGTQRPCWQPSWDPLFLSIPTSARWQPKWACARSPHLRLGNDSDTICNDLPSMTQYCPLLAPRNQIFQEVTHPGTTLTEVRLTAEF
jgi:hypothetical protein